MVEVGCREYDCGWGLDVRVVGEGVGCAVVGFVCCGDSDCVVVIFGESY